MDPVTAFSLAAGALSVLDVGFRALSTCREIYQNGSLSEHRDTQEITEQLLETTKQLESSVRSVLVAGARHSKDIVDISKKCSETATELLSQLRKLQQDPKSGFRETIGKSLRAMRKKQYLAEIQRKLERERDILNTRILSKLDHDAVLQLHHLDGIDQNVRDLAVALSQGRNTFQQLLAGQTIVIQNHVDRRLDAKANEEEALKSQQKFKDSLFFPEIFARQEDISRSHEGTCKWIFGPPCDGDESHSDSETDSESSDSENGSGSSDSEDEYDHWHETRAQPWSSFKNWLEGDSNDPYWLSGKPGSGKSTLMKYVATEFGKFCYSRTTLSSWRGAIICCFFFCNLGSSLQKNYAGFLRSLLFQIAEQRAEMIPIMRDDATCQTSRPHDASLLFAWTEQRLEDALKRFLGHKSPSMRVCMFIDGLDEFVGDEDHLVEIIRLLSQTSGMKVCVSSRPEQIFRQGFAASPNLKLQDLNYHDIRKAVSERLTPALRSYTSCSERETNDLVEQVIDSSHGVFLWAELMTKDLKAGARNADSIAELRDRLERTPETIDGLYEHMLNRLDKAYLRDAAKYFSHLLVYQESNSFYFLPPTLLELACSEQNPWYHPIRLGSELFASANVVETCNRLETRIITRCAGLVDIKERPTDPIEFINRMLHPEYRPSANSQDNDYTQYLRNVEFIHKTAVDFLMGHGSLLDDADLHCTGRLTLIRGQIIISSLALDVLAKRESARGPVVLSHNFMGKLMDAPQLSESCSQEMRNAAVRTVEDLYNLLRYLDTNVNEARTAMSQIYPEMFRHSWAITQLPERSPLYDCLNFASFFSRDDYVARFMAENDLSRADFERVLSCAVMGIGRRWHLSFKDVEGPLAILRNCMKGAIDLDMNLSYATNKAGGEILLWALFLASTIGKPGIIRLIRTKLSSGQTSHFAKLWKDVFQLFLNADADPNVMLVHFIYSVGSPSREPLSIEFAETPLALIERTACFFQVKLTTLVEDIEDLLRSHGGTKRRVFLSVENDRGDWRLLTEDQSNRLVDAFSPKRLADSRTSIYRSWVTIEPMPSQPDPKAEELVTLLIDEARYLDENPDWWRKQS